MIFFLVIGLVVCASAAAFLILLLGPLSTCRKTPLGKAHKWLTRRLPSALGRVALSVLGRRNMNRLKRLFNWIGYERNPLVQLFYVFLMLGSAALFLHGGGWATMAAPSSNFGQWNRPLYALLWLYSFSSFLAASRADPGTVPKDEKQSIPYRDIWPYDFVLFSPRMCSTCNITKPARSKHCSICKACVMRHDHHCPWINNCVGLGTQKYFIQFLLATMFHSMHVAYLCFFLTLARLEKNKFLAPNQAGNYRFTSPWYSQMGEQAPKADWSTVFMITIYFNTEFVLVGFFGAASALLLVLFIAHYVGLNVVLGRTANEHGKRGDVAWSLKEGKIFLAQDQSDGSQYLTKDPKLPRSLNPIRHVYNRGIWNNLCEFLGYTATIRGGGLENQPLVRKTK